MKIIIIIRLFSLPGKALIVIGGTRYLSSKKGQKLHWTPRVLDADPISLDLDLLKSQMAPSQPPQALRNVREYELHY